VPRCRIFIKVRKYRHELRPYLSPLTTVMLFARPVGGWLERQILGSMSNGVHEYFPVKDGIHT